jgi:hypothetical protein
VDDDYLIRRARELQQRIPKSGGRGGSRRTRELTELAHAYGVSLRTLHRYLAASEEASTTSPAATADATPTPPARVSR